jgi:cytochrome c oxidase assembly protein subunit 15
MPVSSDFVPPIFWQFSLSTINAVAWVALLLLALWIGRRLSWRRLAALTAFLTLDLIAFGAFVRLTDSGLGCPDWPGCYGQLLPVQATTQINNAIIEQGGPQGAVSHSKAWIEMLHRYVASFIGALILVMFVRSTLARVGQRRATLRGGFIDAGVGLGWPSLLLIVVSLQGLFGKWTVTLKLMPIVVTTHLMGGMLLFALLIWFWMREREREGDSRAMTIAVSGRVRAMVWIAVAVMAGQIFLGGWVSTNYAVLACADFPGCGGTMTPSVDWRAGFTFARELGRTPEGTFLSVDALRAIHWAHRIGALITTCVVIAAALTLMRAHAALKRQALWIKVALVGQIIVGISTVLFSQPIALATAHNFLAAVLLATLVVAAYRVSGTRS